MKLDFNIKKDYQLSNISYYVTSLGKYKQDSKFIETTNIKLYDKFLEKLSNNIKTDLSNLLNQHKQFIIENTLCITRSTGDPDYLFTDTKIIIPLAEVSNNEQVMQILGSMIFFIVASLKNKLPYISSCSMLLSHILSKTFLGRSIDISSEYDDIVRNTICILLRQNNFYSFDNVDTMIYNLNVTPLNRKRTIELFDKYNKSIDESLKIYFDTLSKLIKINESTIKQNLINHFGIEMLLGFEDVSNLLLIITTSMLYKRNPQLNEMLKQPKIDEYTNRIIQSILMLYKDNFSQK